MSRTSANFAFSGPVMSANFPGELIFGLPGEAGGYYSICVSQPDNETMRLTFQPSKNTMHPIDPVDIALPQGPKGDAGQADEAQVRALVQEYLTQNPPTVTESDPTVPQWAKAKEKPGYTAAEVGAVSTDALPDAIDEALAQAKESGEFNGITPEFTIGTVETLDAGSDATASISGTKENPVLNLGIPQGLPGEGGSGGGEVWELINEVTTTEPVQQITITSDMNGMPLNLKKMYFIATVITPADADRGTVRVMLNGASATSGMLINATGMAATYGRVVWAYIDTVLKFHLRMQNAGTDSINFVTDVLSTTEESITKNILNRKDFVEKIVVEHTSTMAANSKIKIMGVRA